MRLLLVAYEFPPSPSPQSLRWTYLARELAALGHDVHVLAPDLGGSTPGLPALPPGVTVHRCFAGPFRGLMAVRRKRRERLAQAAAAAPSGDATAPAAALRPPRNWKQRVSEAVQRTLEFVLYPDLRGEWTPWARPALRRLLDALRPDVVVASHEPATTLELVLRERGRAGAGRAWRWVADLGDPVLAGYTAPRWRARAARVERATCTDADLVSVTTEATATLLRERHPGMPRIEVLPQGYDARPPVADGAPGPFDGERLELLYTGSLYRFRRIDGFIEALRTQPSARLNIAAITVPERLLALARELPGQVRLLGFLPHLEILRLQRRAHVLVNIANDDPAQIPGKFHEYLGAGRPILHLCRAPDAMAAMLASLRRGWTCGIEGEDTARLLAWLVRAQRDGTLEGGLDLTQAPVHAWSWQAIGARLDAALRALPPVRTA